MVLQKGQANQQNKGDRLRFRKYDHLYLATFYRVSNEPFGTAYALHPDGRSVEGKQRPRDQCWCRNLSMYGGADGELRF